MRVTKLGHSCLLVEDGDGRVLVDPGGFSEGFEHLRHLTGVLVTHQHPDHVDADRLEALLAANPDARLVTDAGTAAALSARQLSPAVAAPGDRLDLGLTVEVHGGEHALIHPDVPRVPNNAYLLGGRVLHPGDALTVELPGVELLALPATAPWSKVAETADHLRAVRPGRWVPIHDAILSAAGRGLYRSVLQGLAPAGSAMLDLDGAGAVTL